MGNGTKRSNEENTWKRAGLVASRDRLRVVARGGVWKRVLNYHHSRLSSFVNNLRCNQLR